MPPVNRLAVVSALLTALAIPAAHAEGSRSLGLAVAPVGLWAATRVGAGLTAGYGAGLDWDYRREGEWASMGGHLASSAVFLEATPLRVRCGPVLEPFRPFVGLGASFLLPWVDSTVGARADASLRLGGEVSAGLDVTINRLLYVSGEGRYQNFSASADVFSAHRQEIISGYLGVGFRL